MAVSVLALAVPRPAFALDDDGQQNVFYSIFSVFDFHPSHPDADIDFRERAPLVLPPKIDLAKPRASLEHSAAWPKDPDVVRRTRESGILGHFVSSGNIHDHNGQLLTRDELASGPGLTNGGQQALTRYCGRDLCDSKRVSATSLSAQGDKFKATLGDTDSKNVVVAGTEPARKYLTDPPLGYRKATKTITATREAPEIKHDSPLDYIRGLTDKKDDDD